uniref:Uncharacterized protein n=1 Tax=Eutreptiella gymnastica TaxID=73025 RepID=A0A7S1NVF5_9EUGL|mmetsp:Transcript_8885/g.15848  ORF Transcript_8885/g.15848 Transcript_8885/m.15848 type:complete len:103 (+) Transcript_8885:255-563(+)
MHTYVLPDGALTKCSYFFFEMLLFAIKMSNWSVRVTLGPSIAHFTGALPAAWYIREHRNTNNTAARGFVIALLPDARCPVYCPFLHHQSNPTIQLVVLDHTH